MKVFVVIILISFCMAGCDKEGLPSGILEKEKMQAVLWDFIQAEAYTTQFIKKDSIKNDTFENAKLQQQIFALHNISKKEFYNSYDYYAGHVELMRTLLDSISLKAEREKYKILYFKEPLPARISLMPLPPLPLPKPIPMPIPTLSDTLLVDSVKTILPSVFNKQIKINSAASLLIK